MSTACSTCWLLLAKTLPKLHTTGDLYPKVYSGSNHLGIGFRVIFRLVFLCVGTTVLMPYFTYISYSVGNTIYKLKAAHAPFFHIPKQSLDSRTSPTNLLSLQLIKSPDLVHRKIPMIETLGHEWKSAGCSILRGDPSPCLDGWTFETECIRIRSHFIHIRCMFCQFWWFHH